MMSHTIFSDFSFLSQMLNSTNLTNEIFNDRTLSIRSPCKVLVDRPARVLASVTNKFKQVMHSIQCCLAFQDYLK